MAGGMVDRVWGREWHLGNGEKLVLTTYSSFESVCMSNPEQPIPSSSSLLFIKLTPYSVSKHRDWQITQHSSWSANSTLQHQTHECRNSFYLFSFFSFFNYNLRSLLKLSLHACRHCGNNIIVYYFGCEVSK